MNGPDAKSLMQVVDQTWPAAARARHGPWTIRKGAGGGNRVSAATAEAPVTAADLATAETAMQALGQSPLFMIRPGDAALDALLEGAGYRVRDTTLIRAAPVDRIATQRPDPVTTFEVWPPLAVQREIWEAGGIGAGRLAIMDRAATPKTTLLGRKNDRPAGTVFVAVAEGCAMIHALEVAQPQRRLGLARDLTRAAAFWAQGAGADWLTLLVTEANAAANRLYASLGMDVVGQYHYRFKPDD